MSKKVIVIFLLIVLIIVVGIIFINDQSFVIRDEFESETKIDKVEKFDSSIQSKEPLKELSDTSNDETKDNINILKEEISELIEQWKNTPIPHENITHSAPHGFYENDKIIMQRIGTYKVAVLPFLYSEFKDGIDDYYYDSSCVFLFEIITKKDMWSRYTGKNFDISKEYSQWWESGYEEDIKQFKSLYSQYKSASSDAEIDEVSKSIHELGIRILPNVMDKLFEGEEGIWIDVVDYYTDNEFNKSNSQFKKDRVENNVESLPKDKRVQFYKNWWEENKKLYSLNYEKLYGLKDD